jgi:signal transduction histidine kinase
MSSPRRLIEATYAERRELERSLHEGAQQRLVAVRMRLGLLRRLLEPGSEAAREADRIADELDAAFGDLRRLAQAIHPANLSSLGLGAAVDALVRESPGPVEAAVDVDRLPAEVEAVLYRICLEVIAAGAARSITLVRESDVVRFELAADALPADARLQLLRDEVAALDGELDVQGTTLRGFVAAQSSGRMPR